MNNSITMKEIQECAATYAKNSRALKELQDTINAEIADVKSKYIPEMVERARLTVESKKELENMVLSVPELFEKPKTQNFNGCKFGYQKQKGKIEILNPETTIKILKRDYPDIAETVIKTSYTLIKEALNNQSADILKKIGVTITSDIDAVIVKMTDTDIEKIINLILKEDALSEAIIL